MGNKDKKSRLDAAKARTEQALIALRADEAIRMRRWGAQVNPFVAIKDYCSKGQRGARRPFIEAWLKAKEDYSTLVTRS